MKKYLTTIAVALLVAGSYAETLEDWQFNDANNTALNVVTNTGTVGTSWNFGGPRTRAGNLNIGDDIFFSWDPENKVTTRKATFESPLTSGQYVFEFVVADWDMAGTNGVGITGNGIKFNVGSTISNSMMQLEFEVATLSGVSTNIAEDMRVRSQNSNNGSLSGSNVENTLGSLNLTNTASVKVQLIADLDTGDWSTKVDYGSGFEDLVTDGEGMNEINEVQLLIDSSNGTGWEYVGTNNAAYEFIKIDSITLSEQEVVDPEPEPWTKLEYFTFEDGAGKSFNTFANTGDLLSPWNNPADGNIQTDASGLLVVSNKAGAIFRKLPDAGTANANASADEYATPFSTGKYRLELDLDSWAIDPSSVNSTLTWAALDAASAGAISAGLRLKVQNATTARLQIFHSDANFRNVDLGLTNSVGLAISIEFDYDAGTATYYTNGVQTHTFDNFTNELPVATIQFNLNNPWSSNSVVKIGEMGFSQFNEAAVPVLAVDFNASQIITNFQHEYFDFALNPAGSPQLTSPEYTGQPIYAGLELDPVNGWTTGVDDGGAYTNGGAVSFGKTTTGAKVQWNGPFSSPPVPGADTGRYEEDDVATGVFLFKKADFLNGLDAGTVFMNATNDTLSATVKLDAKSPARLKSGKFRWVVQDAGNFYISAEVTNLTSDTGNVTLTDEALNLSWFSYDPETSATAIAGASSPTLQDIDALGFWMSATILTNNGLRAYPNMQCSSFEAQAGVVPVAGPLGQWEEWLGDFALGTDTNFQDDADGDLVDNLSEYAFGGNPIDSNDQGNTPVSETTADSGTNYLLYVYYERDDAGARGLSSTVEAGTDLVFTNWSASGVESVGSGASGISGYNAVTNRIPTDTEDRQFIRLQIEFTP